MSSSTFNLVHGKVNADVQLQDQTTPTLITKFNKVTNSTTLAEIPIVGQRDIVVTSATGISIGSYIIIFDPLCERFSFYYATAVDGVTITLDSPIDFACSVGSYVDIAITNLNVNGSITPQVFGLRGLGTPSGADVTVDITRLIFHGLTTSAVDLSKFANITALINGIVLRKRDGSIYNIFNVKSNGELAGIMYDFTVTTATNPSQGVDGFTGRMTFSGQEKMGVAIRLPVGDDLEIIIQDDLTGITLFEIIAEGHVVEN